ncbi:MAG TPA: plastocyanin/azurin family copper-binding protein [Ktedonobacterales bacterium]|nr:plastocyanin/azurin family copper-binding protein [Ktedonobacterales bacterium]
MRKFVPGFMGLILLCVLALAACGGGSAASTPTDTPLPPAPTATTAPAAPTATTGGSAGAATIGMGAQTFTNTSVTIKAGQSVTFNDPSDTGNVHDLVTGSNGQFKAATGAPTEFASSSGVSFSPGDSKTIKFPTAGTFTITCTIHPNMLTTVKVTP